MVLLAFSAPEVLLASHQLAFLLQALLPLSIGSFFFNYSLDLLLGGGGLLLLEVAVEEGAVEARLVLVLLEGIPNAVHELR